MPHRPPGWKKDCTMTEDRGAAGPYIEYDGLPVLHGREAGLALAHPYGPLDAERSLTPGGGRLTVQRTAAHHRITLDHLGCPAQATTQKNAAFQRLALAAEGHCAQQGCRHRAAYRGGVLRHFEFPVGSIEPTAFLRALLAIELGDFSLADRLTATTAELVGPPGSGTAVDGAGQAG
ncbi:DUF6420 family protein [Streptomyces prasinus]|uniref:DUF6420 family protein n=1 Tax=Streptomyces prasinus TaxID=67345 RepID=UPI0036A2938D